MLHLLAAGDPYEHTWNSWTLHLYRWDIHLDAIPGLYEAGVSKFVVMMLCAAALVAFIGIMSPIS